jgi:N-acetylglucosaminyl-diphospho-decaprenol L-rhamnosyltransferase
VSAANLTSVLVVAANSGNDLIACVERALASSVPVEVIVSDNASQDGSVVAVEARWHRDARVRIVRNERNLGFGTGCNRAAAQARGDVLLILNPDCLLEVDAIARLREALVNDKTIGIAGATIVDARGRYEPASRRRDPLLRRALATMTGLSRSGVDVQDAAHGAIEDVDAVSGALIAMPADMFRLVGGFDEGYFLHCEDLDLCRRVRDLGARVVCVNDIRVVHAKGTSSRRRPVFVAMHKHRGMWRWFTKFDPAAQNALVRTVVWLGLWSHFVVMMPRYWLARQR